MYSWRVKSKILSEVRQLIALYINVLFVTALQMKKHPDVMFLYFSLHMFGLRHASRHVIKLPYLIPPRPEELCKQSSCEPPLFLKM